MIKIRTIKQAVAELKEIDKKTAINESMVRRLIAQNQIKYAMIGNRYLIDPQDIVAYLTETGKSQDQERA